MPVHVLVLFGLYHGLISISTLIDIEIIVQIYILWGNENIRKEETSIKIQSFHLFVDLFLF